MSGDGGSGKNPLGCSESSCSSSSTAEPVRRKKDYGKKDRKIVRILTVVAYVVSVSMAAVLLSTYYVFLWSPDNMKAGATERPRSLHFTQSHPTLHTGGRRGHGGQMGQGKFSQASSSKYAQPHYLYTNANTKAYRFHQIPTPQPLLMMTKILTTAREGVSTTPSTTTTPSPPVPKQPPAINN